MEYDPNEDKIWWKKHTLEMEAKMHEAFEVMNWLAI